MTVDELMTRRLVTVEQDDRLETALRIFSNTPFHHLLVVESGKLVGVVSDRDLFRAISPNIDTPAETSRDRATLNKFIHQIMSRNPITLPSGAATTEVVKILADKPISCVPIVDGQSCPLGIISWRDVMKVIRDTGLMPDRSDRGSHR